MSMYRGILNDNGLETNIRIFFDLKKNDYTSDFFANNIRSDINIRGDICTIIRRKRFTGFPLVSLFDDNEFEYTNYKLYISKYENEIIITGKEIANQYWCIPCMPRPKFFVVTNKEEA